MYIYIYINYINHRYYKIYHNLVLEEYNKNYDNNNKTIEPSKGSFEDAKNSYILK